MDDKKFNPLQVPRYGVALAVGLGLLVAGCGPNTEPGGEVGSGIDWSPSTTPVQAPMPSELDGGR